MNPNQYAASGPSEDFAEAFMIAAMGYDLGQSSSPRPQRIQYVRNMLSLQTNVAPRYSINDFGYARTQF